MGATNFRTIAYGKTPQQSFKEAKEDALYENGHGGYTGSIAEKPGFTILEMPDISWLEKKGMSLEDWIDLKENENDKWGNAFCICLGYMVAGIMKGQNKYLFFGMASE